MYADFQCAHVHSPAEDNKAAGQMASCTGIPHTPSYWGHQPWWAGTAGLNGHALFADDVPNVQDCLMSFATEGQSIAGFTEDIILQCFQVDPNSMNPEGRAG